MYLRRLIIGFLFHQEPSRKILSILSAILLPNYFKWTGTEFLSQNYSIYIKLQDGNILKDLPLRFLQK
jgi:hypothetical protein